RPGCAGLLHGRNYARGAAIFRPGRLRYRRAPMTLPVVTARPLLVAALLVASLSACQSRDAAAPAPAQTAQTASLASPSPTPAPAAPTVRLDALAGASQDASTPGAYRYRVQIPQLDGLPPRSQPIDTLIKSRLQMRVDAFVDLARQAQGSPP